MQSETKQNHHHVSGIPAEKLQKIRSGKHPLMSNTSAPMNRTLFLDEEDFMPDSPYSQFPRLEDIEGTPIDELRDQIIWGDCIKGMRLLPDNCVDFIFADPPYYGMKRKFSDQDFPWRTLDEYLAWSEEWLLEAKRIMKPHASLYVCSVWGFSAHLFIVLEKHFNIMNRITWKREKGRGAARNWKNNMEDIMFCVLDEGKYIFNLQDVKVKKEIIAPYRDENGKRKDWVEKNGERFRLTHPSNIWIDMTVPFWSMPENTPHPTQKPQKLVERCMLASTHPGMLCLDPFMGAGTTAAAALTLGRNYLGFETNDDFIRLARKRLDTRFEASAT